MHGLACIRRSSRWCKLCTTVRRRSADTHARRKSQHARTGGVQDGAHSPWVCCCRVGVCSSDISTSWCRCLGTAALPAQRCSVISSASIASSSPWRACAPYEWSARQRAASECRGRPAKVRARWFSSRPGRVLCATLVLRTLCWKNHLMIFGTRYSEVRETQPPREPRTQDAPPRHARRARHVSRVYMYYTPMRT